MQKTQVGCYLFVQQAERVRHVNLAQPAQLIAHTQAIAGGGFLATTIRCQYSCMRKGRRMKGAGSVRDVMFDKMPAIIRRFRSLAKTSLQVVGRAVEQVARCVDNRRQKEWVPGRFPLGRGWMRARFQGKRNGCLITMATEQQPGVVGVRDMIDICQGYTGFTQTVIDGVKW